jgi:hypothetical protein
MAAKNSRHASAARKSSTSAESESDTSNGETAVNGVLAPMNLLSDMTRQQMSLVTEATSAVLGNSEAIGRIQQEAIHQATLRHQEAAETLRGAVEPMDVFTLQSNLVRQDLQDFAHYWAQLASVTFKTQLDMISRVADVMNAGPQTGVSTAIDTWRSAMALATQGGEERSDLH